MTRLHIPEHTVAAFLGPLPVPRLMDIHRTTRALYGANLRIENQGDWFFITRPPIATEEAPPVEPVAGQLPLEGDTA